MYPFDIEIIYGIFNAISDTIIRKQEVSFTSCFLYTLKQSAISGFVEKGLKAGDQTKRLSYSSPADQLSDTDFFFSYSLLSQYHRPFSNTYYKYSFSTMVISDLRFANIANVPVVVKKVF